MSELSQTASKTASQDAPLIVTGLSGAGISSTLKHLEDFGYEVFDNFPLGLIDSLMETQAPKKRPIAIGIDTRTRQFDPDQLAEKARTLGSTILFMTADQHVLQKRFTETRRRHPLADDRPVSAGIKKEMEWLWPLRSAANVIIDTTELSIHDLRRTLDGHFNHDKSDDLSITLMSFGFKNGIPREADLMMDVRFLANPNWVAELKNKRGTDAEVGDYIRKHPAFDEFISHYKVLLKPLLPLYQKEGKSYLTIAIGCTGGHHRSVFTVETLKDWITEQGYVVHIQHRDIDR